MTTKDNEVKSKMKQLSDMPTPRFEHVWYLWSNMLPLDHGGAPTRLERYYINLIKNRYVKIYRP